MLPTNFNFENLTFTEEQKKNTEFLYKIESELCNKYETKFSYEEIDFILEKLTLTKYDNRTVEQKTIIEAFRLAQCVLENRSKSTSPSLTESDAEIIKTMEITENKLQSEYDTEYQNFIDEYYDKQDLKKGILSVPVYYPKPPSPTPENKPIVKSTKKTHGNEWRYNRNINWRRQGCPIYPRQKITKEIEQQLLQEYNVKF